MMPQVPCVDIEEIMVKLLYILEIVVSVIL